jgi:hypothetical protein
MSCWLVVILLLATSGIGGSAAAQKAEVQIRVPIWVLDSTLSKPVKLKKGDAAPFEGHLVTTESLARALVEVQTLEDRGKLEKDFLQKKMDAQLSLQESLRKSVLDTEQQKYKLLEEAKNTQATYYNQTIQQLRGAADRKWWESPYLHFGLGFAAAGIISVVTILLLH